MQSNTRKRIVTVYAKKDQELTWVDTLQKILAPISSVIVYCGEENVEPGEIVFIDAALPDIEPFLARLDRKGRAVFLILEDGSLPPRLLSEGKVDDVLIFPFRNLEVLGKIRYYEQIMMWNEVSEISSSFKELLRHLEDDLHLAERLQKAKLPKRFPSVRGFTVSNRYLAGLKNGSDYFDLAESKDRKHTILVLSHSSSYGLASAFLSVLMRVTLKLTLGKLADPHMVTHSIREIYEELSLVLGEKEKLALFYGVISHETQTLRFQSFGNFSVFYSESALFDRLPSQGAEISHSAAQAPAFLPEKEEVLQLHPGGRLALLSYGFVEALGGEGPVSNLLNRFRDQEPNDSLNELTFQVKSKLSDKDEMPERDCTAVILDLTLPALKLSKPRQDES